jgi:hypothetical protein
MSVIERTEDGTLPVAQLFEQHTSVYTVELLDQGWCQTPSGSWCRNPGRDSVSQLHLTW